MNKVIDKRVLQAKINGMLGGRPKGSLGETALYKREIKRLIAEKVYQSIGKMTDAQILEAIRGSTMAYVALLDRSIDKPTQAVEHSGQDGNPIVFMPIELIQKHALQVEQKVIDVKEVQKDELE